MKKIDEINSEGEICYPPQAQEIFNKHFDEVEQEFSN